MWDFYPKACHSESECRQLKLRLDALLNEKLYIKNIGIKKFGSDLLKIPYVFGVNCFEM
jgi:hypothetical protein